MDTETSKEFDFTMAGEKIRVLRKEMGINQTELGRMLELKQASITDIENGHLNKMQTVLKLLDVFNISFDYLFEDVINAVRIDKNSDALNKKVKVQLAQMDKGDLLLSKEIISLLNGVISQNTF